MNTRWLVALLGLHCLAGCGDNRAAPLPEPGLDAGCGDACAPTCAVRLTGNVDETMSSAEACPTLRLGGPNDEDVILSFAIPSPALATSVGVQVDVGVMPVAGELSSETVAGWSAVAIERIPPDGACVFLAGAGVTPAGYFTLELSAIESPHPAHGILDMTLSVLPRTTEQGIQTDCGPGTTEHLHVAF